MTYSPIKEPITVCTAFAKDKVRPLSFKWGKHIYKNLKTDLVYRARLGRTPLTYFCVNDGANYFKLMLNGETLEWRLEESG